jgi:hypothetical protein
LLRDRRLALERERGGGEGGGREEGREEGKEGEWESGRVGGREGGREVDSFKARSHQIVRLLQHVTDRHIQVESM